MKQIKYDVGESVLISGVVREVHISEDNTVYYSIEFQNTDTYANEIKITEEHLGEVDAIQMSEYEAEIADLKDDIVQLKEMYQLEHMKFLKAKYNASAGTQGDSHHPQTNVYSDDWRRP